MDITSKFHIDKLKIIVHATIVRCKSEFNFATHTLVQFEINVFQVWSRTEHVV